MNKYKLLLLVPTLLVFCFFMVSYLISSNNTVLHQKHVRISAPVSHDVAKLSKNDLPTINFIKIEVFFPRLVYNRVGKCGSRSMQIVIAELSKVNEFQFYLSPISNQTRLPALDLENEVRLIYSIQSPMLYSRHIAYVNFAKYGLMPPVYINMIRDPIERFSSQYHFKRNGDMRNPGKGRTLKPMSKATRELDINDCVLKNYTECSAEKLWYIVPYFCGQDPICKRPSFEALQLAKQHLIENYLAVGFVEDFEGTLQIFEKLVPFYFKGAVNVWRKLSSFVGDTSTYKKKLIRPEVRSILHQRMEYEYDFYRLAYTRFKSLKAQLKLK